MYIKELRLQKKNCFSVVVFLRKKIKNKIFSNVNFFNITNINFRMSVYMFI